MVSPYTTSSSTRGWFFVDFDALFEIVDGRSCGIHTLIRHTREVVFPLTEHESNQRSGQAIAQMDVPTHRLGLGT